MLQHPSLSIATCMEPFNSPQFKLHDTAGVYQAGSMPNSSGTESTSRRKNVIFNPWAYISLNPASYKYEQYFHQSLLQHKWFLHMDNVTGYHNHIDYYVVFLQSGHWTGLEFIIMK